LIFQSLGVDSPLLCSEEDKMQSEPSASGAAQLPYPVRLRRGMLIMSLGLRERSQSIIQFWNFIEAIALNIIRIDAEGF
jgi:hypothetical protein